MARPRPEAAPVMTIDLSCSRPALISHPLSVDAPSIATAVRASCARMRGTDGRRPGVPDGR